MKKTKKTSKRGELTTAQIVTLVVLIVSFIILIFFLFKLNPAETTAKEACHNSVILSEKGKGLVGGLDCSTSYVCISGGSECTNFVSTSTREIDISDEKLARNQTLKALADEIADCWWMFGEGKINYGVAEGTSIKYALCSSIEFDEDVQKNIPEISYSELYEYMKTHTISSDNSQSYLRYIYGVNNPEAIEIQQQFTINIAQDKIFTGQRYSVITGIDDNIGVGDTVFPDEFLKVYIIPASETSSRLTDGEFITKS